MHIVALQMIVLDSSHVRDFFARYEDASGRIGFEQFLCLLQDLNITQAQVGRGCETALEPERASPVAIEGSHTTPTTEKNQDVSANTFTSTISMELPEKVVGLVIGAGGSTVHAIENLTACRIQLDRLTPGMVWIQGYDDLSTSQAKQLVLDASRCPSSDDVNLMLKSRSSAARAAISYDRLRFIKVTSPLTRDYYVSVSFDPAAEIGTLAWHTWCPNCRRPLGVNVYDATSNDEVVYGETLPIIHPPRGEASPRCAYAAALWGDQPGFVLGAIVLGHQLKSTSAAGHDRVLLHTSEVPGAALGLLEQLWNLKLVSYVSACPRLFFGGEQDRDTDRFAGTFTKLHVLGLLEYDKVLLLDLDLVILRCIDELFDLPAPAAMCRGMNDRWHGSKIDGRSFFRGDEAHDDGAEDSPDWSWSQGGGINAGVMLLQPNARLHQRSLREVEQDLHPAHIPGAGPEQDYLSRMYAPFWTHISMRYNFQLHHVFHALESVLTWWSGTDNDKDLPTRLLMTCEDVSVIHFSGTLKMWDRHHGSDETDQSFSRRVLRDCDAGAFDRWVLRSATAEQYQSCGVGVTESDGQRILSSHNGSNVDELVAQASEHAQRFALLAAQKWRESLQDVISFYIETYPDGGHSCLRLLGEASAPEEAEFVPLQTVEMWWESTQEWYPCFVKDVRPDGLYNVEFLVPDWWGTTVVASRHDLQDRPSG